MSGALRCQPRPGQVTKWGCTAPPALARPHQAALLSMLLLHPSHQCTRVQCAQWLCNTLSCAGAPAGTPASRSAMPPPPVALAGVSSSNSSAGATGLKKGGSAAAAMPLPTPLSVYNRPLSEDPVYQAALQQAWESAGVQPTMMHAAVATGVAAPHTLPPASTAVGGVTPPPAPPPRLQPQAQKQRPVQQGQGQAAPVTPSLPQPPPPPPPQQQVMKAVPEAVPAASDSALEASFGAEAGASARAGLGAGSTGSNIRGRAPVSLASSGARLGEGSTGPRGRGGEGNAMPGSTGSNRHSRYEVRHHVGTATACLPRCAASSCYCMPSEICT